MRAHLQEVAEFEAHSADFDELRSAANTTAVADQGGRRGLALDPAPHVDLAEELL